MTADQSDVEKSIFWQPEQEEHSERFPATSDPIAELTLELQAPLFLPITSLILQWMCASPEHVAVSSGGQSWSYGTLQSLTAHVTRQLAEAGVQQGNVVAVLGPSSLGVVVSALAVLFRGGVLLLVDEAIPFERRKAMLEEATAHTLIRVGKFSSTENLDAAAVRTIVIDPVTGTVIGEGGLVSEATLREPDLPVDAAAYLCFTSGTTGIPRGVRGCHQGLSHFLDWQRTQFSVGPLDRVAQLTSLSFDVVLRELFLPLTSGGTLCLPNPAVKAEGSRLFEWMRREEITILHAVPSLARFWLEDDDSNLTLPSLRRVFFAGEPLTNVIVRRWKERVSSQCAISNLYGPTETTLAKFHYEVPSIPRPGVQPVGSPLPQTQALILDSSGKVCEVGDRGEIVLRTPFRSLGYLKPEVPKKFVVNPFRNDEKDLVYFTGDEGRYLPDGTLEIAGRIDDQVKIHGVRVEPAEIAALVETHPAVNASVVIPITGKTTMLAVYVVLLKNAKIDVEELRSFLADRFPIHVASVSFTVLDELPLNANGKVNRKALPSPSVSTQTYRAPVTTTEQTLCGMFAEVLKLDRVGMDDNFFALGGHSLLATRLVSQARSAFAIELPIRVIFETPTVAGLAARLRDFQQTRPPLVQQSRPDRLPLSAAQSRLWFLHHLEGPSATYNIPLARRLRGNLDVAAFQAALNDVVGRHESLRTIITVREGEPWQQIIPTTQANLTLKMEAVTESELSNRLAATAASTFELTSDLPLRAWLFQVSADHQVLLLVLHHIVGDGSSHAPLWRDLVQAYTARLGGQAPAWDSLPVQYADYTLWQRDWLGSEGDPNSEMTKQTTFWKQVLAGLPEELKLPADRPRPSESSYCGGTVPLKIDAELHRKLIALASSEGASLFMVLQAGLSTLLSHLGAGEDIALGCPIAGRGEQSLEHLVGFFVNTLVLRADLSGNPSFRELLHRVREFDLNAYEHQDLPFQRTVHALQPTRSKNRHPLFQVLFVLQNTEEAELSLPGVEVTLETVEQTTAKFDLTFGLMELWGPSREPLGLAGEIEYSSDLFNAETARRFADYFLQLLNSITKEPDKPISRLNLMRPEERHKILVEWNQTQVEYPRDKCVHHVFEQQVDRMPDAIAVEFEEQSLTYRELNARANQLAHYLQKLGVREETRVGISVDRSFEMIVGLLAILKAGGAYVPLDPHYPSERLDFLVSDTGTSLVLSQRRLQKRWKNADVRLLILDSEDPEWSAESDENVCSNQLPNSLAYVIYTSGSTGIPKGVEVLHRGIVRLVCGANYVQLDQTQSVLQLAVLTFDASTFEIWGPLLHGGRSVLAPSNLPDPEELQSLLRRKKIRVLWLTSTLFNALVDSNVATLEGIEQLLVGGEALSVSHIRRAQQALGPRTQLINGYGPTESTTFACCYRLPAKVSEDCQSIPIGSPISNTTAYVLDAQGEPVPIGVAGELYIGGDGLARGYLNQPELTAEKFLPDPFSDRPDARLYRTGDLVRWLPDGTIEFLGRRDQQIKLRGFRIEPGEIESVLSRHPDIRQSVVMLREDPPGNKRLIAYIVARSKEAGDNITKLRSYLQERLPEYMIPTAFVMLDDLPRTVNGKVDKQALPLTELGVPSRERSFVAPRTPTEQMLARVWSKVLGVAPIGIHDNFFELGGHSLKAMLVLDRVNHTSTRKLKVVDLFSYATVAELARYLDDNSQVPDVTTHRRYLETIRQGNGETSLVIIGATLRPTLEELPPDVSVWWLGLDGLHVWPHLNLDAKAQAKAHVEELMKANPTGNLLLCGHSYGGLLALEIARQITKISDRQIDLILLEPYPPSLVFEAKPNRLTQSLQNHLDLKRLNRISKLSTGIYLKCAEKFLHLTMPWMLKLGFQIHPESRWRYMGKFLRQNAQNFTLEEPLANDLYLIGTRQYLESNIDRLKCLTESSITTYTVPDHLDHYDIAKAEHNSIWMNIVLRRIAKLGLSRSVRY